MDHEAANGRILDEFARKYVLYCVTDLVKHFDDNEDAFKGSLHDRDDLLPLRAKGPEHAERLDELVEAIGDLAKKLDRLAEAEANELGLLQTSLSYRQSTFDEQRDLRQDTIDKFEQRRTALQAEMDEHNREREALEDAPAEEVLSYWLVSRVLFEELEKRGEAVGELFGLQLWGRTGYSGIADEKAIVAIANDWEILSGQRNDWKC